MDTGDPKSMIISNSIVSKWMDTKHAFLVSNNHTDNELVPVSWQLKTGQLITINCPKAIDDYNQFIRGVDWFNWRISYYILDRKSKTNWIWLFIYSLNVSIFNSIICDNQLAQGKLSYLNYMVSVVKSLWHWAEKKP
jgi:hypothetical protein